MKKTPASLAPKMDARLSSLALRLAALKLTHSENLGLVSITIGAIYALDTATRTYGYEPQSRRTQATHVQKALAALADGRAPLTCVYLAGYYFNDALLRVDIAFENVLRRITGLKSKQEAQDLVKAAVKANRIDPKHGDAWLTIRRREVNRLKHRNPEQIEQHKSGKAVPVSTVIEAIENLVSMMGKVIPVDRKERRNGQTR
jgi:hypothetical protein